MLQTERLRQEGEILYRLDLVDHRLQGIILDANDRHIWVFRPHSFHHFRPAHFRHDHNGEQQIEARITKYLKRGFTVPRFDDFILFASKRAPNMQTGSSSSTSRIEPLAVFVRRFVPVTVRKCRIAAIIDCKACPFS